MAENNNNTDIYTEEPEVQNSGLTPLADGFPRYRQIYEHLLRDITSGKLKPGDRIPSETELCAAFKVSRITSKKALEMLTESHLISRQRGKGSFVAGPLTQEELRKNPAAFRVIAFLISAFNDSFGNRLLHSVEAACEALGFHLILKFTHESPVEEEKALRSLDDKNVAGILMVPVHGEYYNAEILRQVLKKRPLVFVDRKMWGLPVPSVSSDCTAASEMAVKRLLEKGHRNIAFFSGNVLHTSTVEDRQQGYFKAFSAFGISPNPDHICDKLSSADNFNIMLRHLSDHPEISAGFTTEFEIAMLVKRVLAKLGKKRIDKFDLVTFDRPDYAVYFPEITCLRQDEEAIGRQAVKILHRIIQGEPSESIGDIKIPVEIVQG